MTGPPTVPPANYFAFIEGPVWIGSVGTGTLFFSDNASSPQERIFKLVPPSTTTTVFMEPSGSNGMAVDNDDKLVVADQRNLRITQVDPVTGMTLKVIVPAGAYKPNDVLVRGDNNIYFTDPDTGFYRVAPSGTVTGPLKQVNRPNGLALSPDENTLYVGDVGNKQIHKFALASDGTVTVASDMLFVTAMYDLVDGMCVDCAGNLYTGTSGGVEVYSPAGTNIGLIPSGLSSNCTFGGIDRKTIYITSAGLLKAATLNVPGLPD